MQIALFEPDIPQNTGTILRLAACLGIKAHIIEPAGFPTSDRAFRRAGMDYLAEVEISRHANWEAFEAWRTARRCASASVHHARVHVLSRSRIPQRGCPAVRPRIIGCAGQGACCRRCTAGDPDPSRDAFAQCGDRRRHRDGGSNAADRSNERTNTRRVKDNLTPLGAALHPPRSLALVADSRLPNPHASGGDITLPDIPHDANVSRNNGKKEPAANFPVRITAERRASCCDGIDVLADDGCIAMA